MSKPLDLLWARYDTKAESKHYLLIYLGEQDNKTYGILSDSITDQEVMLIRAKKAELIVIDLGNLIQWFKNNVPKGYTGLRTFDTKTLTIINTNDIKAL